MVSLANVNAVRQKAGASQVVLPKSSTPITSPTNSYVAPPTNQRQANQVAASQPVMKNRGLTVGAPSTGPTDIMVHSEGGGDMGYSSSDWEPITDSVGNVTGVRPKTDQSATVLSTNDLHSLYEAGKINDTQYNSALAQFQKGAKGVNPYGFGKEELASSLRDRLSKLIPPTSPNEGENPADFQARIAYMEQEKASIMYQLQTLSDQQQMDVAPVAQPSAPQATAQGGSVTTTTGSEADSRQAVVQDLIAQGVTDPSQMLNYLNFKEDGTPSGGDFTLPEVQQLMGQGSEQGGHAGPGQPPATGTAGGTGQTGQPSAPSPAQNYALASLPPELQPLVAPILAELQGEQGQAGSILLQTIKDIQNHRSLADLFYQDSKDTALESRNRQLQLSSALGDIDRKAAGETQRKALADNQSADAIFRVNENHAEYVQQMNNLQTEKENMLVAAQNGTNVSTQGIDWMQTQRARGQEALSFMIQRAGLAYGDFANQRIGIVNKFYDDIKRVDFDQQQHYDNAFADYNSSLSTLRKERAMDTQTQDEAETKALSEYYGKIDTINQRHGTLYEKLIDKTLAKEQQQKLDENKSRDDARSFFEWSMVSSSDPTIRKQASDAMTKAGFDMTGIDLNAATPAERLKAMEAIQKQQDSGLYDVFRYADQESQGIMSDALNAVAAPNMSAELQKAQLHKVGTLLDAGKPDQAREAVRGIIVSALTGKPKDDFIAYQQGIKQADTVASDLDALNKKGEIRGLYSYKWEDAKKYLAQSKNADWLDVTSKMSALTADELHQKYGSRLTEFEMKSAENYLPLPKDTVRDALVKIRNLRTLLSDKSETIIGVESGQGGAAGSHVGSSSSGTPSYGNDWMQNTLGGKQAAGDTQLMSVLKDAGFQGEGLKTAYAVAKAESGGKATAYNGNTKTGDNSYGLFQINMLGKMGPDRLKRYGLKSNEDLYDPLTNAKVAYAMSGGGASWSPWSTYKKGSHKQYLKEASSLLG